MNNSCLPTAICSNYQSHSTLSTLENIFNRQQIDDIFLIFPWKQVCHFLQIVSIEDNLHEMSYLFCGKNKGNIINLSSAKLAQRMVKIKQENKEMSTFDFVGEVIQSSLMHQVMAGKRSSSINPFHFLITACT